MYMFRMKNAFNHCCVLFEIFFVSKYRFLEAQIINIHYYIHILLKLDWSSDSLFICN